MKITCQSCQAKYTIADEKVAGKTVKIKCKKCGATIVVHGNEGGKPAASPQLDAPPARQGEDEGEGETRVFADAPPGAGGDEWTVNVTDDDQKTMTTAQIVADYAKGIVTQDTYVWKDGMGDWSPLSGVPELMALVGKAGHAGFDARPPAQAPPAAQGFGGTMMMDGAEAAQTPFAAAGAAPPAAAARRAGAKGGVDLFGAGGPAAEHAHPPTAAIRPPPESSDRQVGERNENSVLFSLAALTATENAAKAKSRTSEDGVLDLRSSGGGGARNGRAGMDRAGIDDIMNLGGGMSAAPMLAPPPLLAPVVEAPVAPAMIAPVAPLGGPMAFSTMASPKKSPVGLIVGIGAALAVVAGAGFFFLRSSPPPPEPPKAEATVATKPSSAPTSVAAVATASPTAAPAAPPDTAVAATSPSAAAVTPGAHTAPTPAPGPGPAVASSPKTPDRGTPTPTPATPAPATPTPPPAATPPAAAAPDTAGGNGRDFDRSAAMKALSAASAGARGCKTADGPTGSGKVKVTFAPSGNVTSATVQGPPYAGTSVGGCVASAFRGAHVPAFDGSPVSVSKSFNID